MFKPHLSPELDPILEWMMTLKEKESTWLRIDMEQKYPLLKEWLKKNLPEKS